jgi:hypothetical protein
VLIVRTLWVDSAKEKIGLLYSFKLDNPTATAGISAGLASDWALISLEDQYVRPNMIKLEGTEKLIPITGYLSMAELKAGKVWVCTNRGPQLGALVQSTTIMGMGRNVFETRGILLEEELSTYPCLLVPVYLLTSIRGRRLGILGCSQRKALRFHYWSNYWGAAGLHAANRAGV